MQLLLILASAIGSLFSLVVSIFVLITIFRLPGWLKRRDNNAVTTLRNQQLTLHYLEKILETLSSLGTEETEETES